jgi:hypothetical protein
MVLKPPEAAQTPKTDPTNSGQIAFRYPVGLGAMAVAKPYDFIKPKTRHKLNSNAITESSTTRTK